MKTRKNGKRERLELENFTRKSFPSFENNERTRNGTIGSGHAAPFGLKPISKMSLNGCKNKR